MALNDSMRIVFMGGPVPVPVLEGGAYAGANAVRVNAAMAIQPPGGHAAVPSAEQIAGKEKAAGNQRLSPNSLGAKK
ncbi:hypothetical protein [Xanthomonas hortorum]|uniref:hypothetical protein n=1 Tax=Xanthomonas hortorum TaxID=56454 RepID=UPI001C3D7861|nr:hypothetical protein [Xanthomonas hortorum]NHF66582.1 hypothetical protein [Xanthomonas hortorum]